MTPKNARRYKFLGTRLAGGGKVLSARVGPFLAVFENTSPIVTTSWFGRLLFGAAPTNFPVPVCGVGPEQRLSQVITLLEKEAKKLAKDVQAATRGNHAKAR